MGVTTKKNIIPITSGETIFPSIRPKLYHNLFNGVRIAEFLKPKNKKITDIDIDHVLISSLFITGYKATNKNTIKKTIPKFLLDGKFIFLFFFFKQVYLLNQK